MVVSFSWSLSRLSLWTAFWSQQDPKGTHGSRILFWLAVSQLGLPSPRHFSNQVCLPWLASSLGCEHPSTHPFLGEGDSPSLEPLQACRLCHHWLSWGLQAFPCFQPFQAQPPQALPVSQGFQPSQALPLWVVSLVLVIFAPPSHRQLAIFSPLRHKPLCFSCHCLFMLVYCNWICKFNLWFILWLRHLFACFNVCILWLRLLFDCFSVCVFFCFWLVSPKHSEEKHLLFELFTPELFELFFRQKKFRKWNLNFLNFWTFELFWSFSIYNSFLY